MVCQNAILNPCSKLDTGVWIWYAPLVPASAVSTRINERLGGTRYIYVSCPMSSIIFIQFLLFRFQSKTSWGHSPGRAGTRRNHPQRCFMERRYRGHGWLYETHLGFDNFFRQKVNVIVHTLGKPPTKNEEIQISSMIQSKIFSQLRNFPRFCLWECFGPKKNTVSLCKKSCRFGALFWGLGIQVEVAMDPQLDANRIITIQGAAMCHRLVGWGSCPCAGMCCCRLEERNCFTQSFHDTSWQYVWNEMSYAIMSR